jgi:hypothetical protein
MFFSLSVRRKDEQQTGAKQLQSAGDFLYDDLPPF